MERHFILKPDMSPAHHSLIASPLRSSKETHDRVRAQQFEEFRLFDSFEQGDSMRAFESGNGL